LGECASMVLVAAVEYLFSRGTDMPQSAAGPALWLKQRAGPAVVSEIAKSLLVAAAVTLVTFGLVSIGSKPAILGAFIAIALVFWSQFNRSGKE